MGDDTNSRGQEHGVQHLIWSSLLDINKLSGGKYTKVYHFDSKAEVETYIRGLGIPATFYLPGFYMSNVTSALQKLPPDDAYTLPLNMAPTAPVPLFAAELDTGKFVKAVLKNRDALLGKRIYAAASYYTPDDCIAAFKKVYPDAGKSARFQQVSDEQYMGALASAGMPLKAQEELAQNMAFINDFGYYGGQSLDETLALLEEKPTTIEEFMAQAKGFKGLK